MSNRGFEKINYKGEELKLDVDDSTAVAYYQHIYRASFNNDSPKKHMCLQWGAWCWKQVWENPLEVRYWLKHLFQLKR